MLNGRTHLNGHDQDVIWEGDGVGVGAPQGSKRNKNRGGSDKEGESEAIIQCKKSSISNHFCPLLGPKLFFKMKKCACGIKLIKHVQFKSNGFGQFTNHKKKKILSSGMNRFDFSV